MYMYMHMYTQGVHARCSISHMYYVHVHKMYMYGTYDTCIQDSSEIELEKNQQKLWTKVESVVRDRGSHR